MRRKDGRPKLKARRTLPEYLHGFWQSPETADYRHTTLEAPVPPGHWTAVSLFAGCGGLDLSFLGGFEACQRRFAPLPFEVLEALDNAPDTVACYNLNLGPHARCADLTTLPVEEIRRADVLMGGFPCQDFSSSGPKTGFDGKRGQLYRVLVEYMQHHRPKIVVGENVNYLGRLHSGRYLETILRECEEVGYHFDVWELYGPDYGLPQSRRRLFLVGVRDDFAGFPAKPKATHRGRHLTISEALHDLEGIQDESVPNQSQYFVSTCATSGGGQGDHTNDPDKVSYCIRANARGRIQFHYRLPRRLTVRECARLQSFPDQFVFPFTTQRNLTLIGNAVPPLLGHAVAQSIAAYLAAVDRPGDGSSTHSAKDVVQLSREHFLQPSLFAV